MITFVKSYHNTISGNITTDLKELSNEIKKNTEETYKVLHGIEDFQKEFTEFVSGKYHLPSKNTRRPLCALANSLLPSERLYIKYPINSNKKMFNFRIFTYHTV